MSQSVETRSIYCSQCGKQGRADARFCSGCGYDHSAGVEPSTLVQMGQGNSAEEEVAPEAMQGSAFMTLGMAWMIYLAAVLIWVGAMALPKVPLGTLVYLVAGFVMTRYVMRGVMEFHPVYSTVANVFSAKVWMFLLWPLNMLILLFKLTVNSAL